MRWRGKLAALPIKDADVLKHRRCRRWRLRFEPSDEGNGASNRCQKYSTWTVHDDSRALDLPAASAVLLSTDRADDHANPQSRNRSDPGTSGRVSCVVGLAWRIGGPMCDRGRPVDAARNPRGQWTGGEPA